MADAHSENGAHQESVALVLERERERAAALELRVEALESSEAFRVGHAFVSFLRGWRRMTRRNQPKELPAGTQTPTEASTDTKQAWVPKRILVVCLDEDLERVEADLATLKTMLVACQPILLADTSGIRPKHDVILEHLVPTKEWNLRRPGLDWGRYVSGRVKTIMQEYEPNSVIILSESPDLQLPALTAALAPLTLPDMNASDSNLLE